MTRRVVVSQIQRLGDLALDGFGAFSLGTKPSAMTRATTALGQKQPLRAGRNGRLTKHLLALNTIPNGEQHIGTIMGLRCLAKYKAPDSASIIIYHSE